jgi:hypothetical protein
MTARILVTTDGSILAEHGLAVAQQAATAVAGALRSEGVDAEAAADGARR